MNKFGQHPSPVLTVNKYGQHHRTDILNDLDYIKKINSARWKNSYLDVGVRRVVRVRDPINSSDAINLKWFNTNIPTILRNLLSTVEKRISLVHDPEQDKDVVTLGYLKDYIKRELEIYKDRLFAESKLVSSINESKKETSRGASQPS